MRPPTPRTKRTPEPLERQQRLLTVLLLGLAVVGGALWLWEPPDPSRLDGADVPVWQVDAEAIRELHLTRGTELVRARRSGERWRLVEPLDAPVDERELAFLLAQLARVRWGEPLDGVDPGDLGLSPARAVVRLTTEDGATHTVALGDQLPTGGRTYARVADGRIVALTHSVEDVVALDVDALRDRTVLPFDPAAVRRVAIESAEGTLEVSGAGRRWWVSGYTRADPGAVEALVFGLRRLRFLSFSPDLAPEGLADAAFTLTVEAGEQTWTLQVGEETPMGAFARRGDGLAGWLVPEEAAGVLRAGPPDLIDRRAFAFDADEDEAVEVRIDATTHRLTRGAEGWACDSLDAEATAALVEALAAARVVVLRAPAPAPGEATAAVRVTRGEHVTDVAIGGLDGAHRLLWDRDGGGAYRVPAAEVQAVLDAAMR